MPSLELPMESFKYQLKLRTAKLKIAYAKRKAKRINEVYTARYGRPYDDIILTQLARKFAISNAMIPEVIRIIRAGVI